jgi:hypothetical protein
MTGMKYNDEARDENEQILTTNPVPGLQIRGPTLCLKLIIISV